MFSIVIPTMNEERLIGRVLESIKAQSLQPHEVILADAQSDDNTREIATQYGAMVVEGGLPSVGRNAGAEAATGEWLLFLDADVVLSDPDFLLKAQRELNERGLSTATCDIYPLSERRIDHFAHWIYNTYARLTSGFWPHAGGFCIFAKRSLHKKINGFDEGIRFCEDHDYVMRAGRIEPFGILKTMIIDVSVRRLDRDGRGVIALRYLLGELHLRLFGAPRSDAFRHSFGYTNKS